MIRKFTFALVALTALMGCSSSRSASPTPSAISSSVATPTSVGVAAAAPVPNAVSVSSVETSATPLATTVAAVVEVVNQPGQGVFEGARQDVADVTCASADGVWTAAGKVTNPRADSVQYRIYVSYLDPAGTTVGLIESDVSSLAAQQSAVWNTKLTSAAEGLTCVLRVERAAVG